MKNMNRRSFLLGLFTLPLVLTAPEAEAGQASRRITSRAWRRLFARDAARDAATKTAPLVKPKNVWRYTSNTEASKAAKSGLPAGRHMTSGVTPGRAPGADATRRRYGLQQKPDVRMTIQLPAGQPLRSNKVLGGARGVGEITSSKALPPSAIRRVVPLD